MGFRGIRSIPDCVIRNVLFSLFYSNLNLELAIPKTYNTGLLIKLIGPIHM